MTRRPRGSRLPGGGRAGQGVALHWLLPPPGSQRLPQEQRQLGGPAGRFSLFIC